MGNEHVKTMIAETFLEVSKGMRTGQFGTKPRIAVTGLGSEHGEENMIRAAHIANQGQTVEVVYIGSKEVEGLECVVVADEDAGHKALEALFDEKKIDGAVTMHYPFPIGVSTVGRSVAPANGNQVYLATTTGTSSVDRVEGMIKNAIYGIITAKSCGIEKPTVGILNVDGARQAEIALKELQEKGYPITFASSDRADGGCILRGNDLLTGAADIVVTDSLTGNVISKLLSSMNTGGAYEAVGDGYGPGIGEGYERLVMIASRASGAPVVAGAITYAAQLVAHDYKKVIKEEFAKANKAGLKGILEARKKPSGNIEKEEVVVSPPKEVVTAQVAGIEVMDLEDAVKELWKVGIYAESGMGCTGPIVLISEANLEKAEILLKEKQFVS